MDKAPSIQYRRGIPENGFMWQAVQKYHHNPWMKVRSLPTRHNRAGSSSVQEDQRKRRKTSSLPGPFWKLAVRDVGSVEEAKRLYSRRRSLPWKEGGGEPRTSGEAHGHECCELCVVHTCCHDAQLLHTNN